MKKLLAIVLLSATTLIQSTYTPKFLINKINEYNAELSEYATLSDEQVTFEMPDCTEATYVYLRVGDKYEEDVTKWAYQRILLTPSKNKETVNLIKTQGFMIRIIPAQTVTKYIQCLQENVKLFTAQRQEREESTSFDTRQIHPITKLMNDALHECQKPKEMFVTGIETYNMKKHIILPTYEEALKTQEEQSAESKEYEKTHPNNENSMELYIPEQTLKFSIKKSN